MGKPTGFLEIPREMPTRRPISERVNDYLEVYNPFPAEKLQRPGRAVHGLRHPLLPPGVPAGQPDPRLERPGLPRPVARGDRPPARDEQLPRVHRQALPRPLRGVVRARDQQRPGHDQADRGEHHRARLGRGLGRPRAPQGAHGQDGGVVGSGPAGLAAAQQLARAGHVGDGLRARRPDRRPAPLRHPRLQDGEAPPRPPDRADGGRGGRPSAPASTSASTCRPTASWPSSTPSASAAARRPRETCRSPAATSTASTSPWTSSRSRTSGSPATRSPTPTSSRRRGSA